MEYNEVASIYQNSSEENDLSEQDTNAMEQLASKFGADVYVFNEAGYLIYPSPLNIGKRERDKINDMTLIYSGFSLYGISARELLISENYGIFNIYDRQMDSNYIDLKGFFQRTYQEAADNSGSAGDSAGSGSSADGTDGAYPNSRNDNESDGPEVNQRIIHYTILIRSNYENIQESVTIANTFLAYIGIAVVILGSAAMFIISRSFTKPILELSGIAKRMADLDFEAKYKVKSKDEIGELGSSINLLSDKLESTISELKQANNELLTDIQKKTEIDEMRKEFLSNVSHELKTPLSLIQGYAEGLKENINEDAESRDFYCEVIMDEAGKMNQMVKKLLSLNELEFGSNQISFERFDIVSLIRSVLEATEILFRQKEVTLYFEEKKPVYVWADEYLTEQVLTNYISNALNHVGGQKIIEIKLIPRDDTVRIAVFNTGENIPEEELDKIWIKFYKVDKARTREYGGSGIGLSIVKAIMNSHNRECGVINRPVGVEFWFELDVKS
jgi:signal transduction histidine kinase